MLTTFSGTNSVSWDTLQSYRLPDETDELLAHAYVDADEDGDGRYVLCLNPLLSSCSLSKREFRALRHPEKSQAVRKRFADHFLRECDSNGDSVRMTFDVLKNNQGE